MNCVKREKFNYWHFMKLNDVSSGNTGKEYYTEPTSLTGNTCYSTGNTGADSD